ncbi:MAG: BMP family ABC transporter substrate-binding protein [Armatimonadota bacterium]|nr:BMP family ABC transporter substrate-binding protein [Armatimonadota bacterium]MDR7467726.1 BMP family ABC transporter substrate-binding protein [Armatimonadota bacterium]MDR7499809.1 BMP family ABC transporter substrate-binding protein [Armatimonadota bacterium]MDR7505245.1 BMP family ABC transporter substrate-binding protein [Armatimonadota bacterium]
MKVRGVVAVLVAGLLLVAALPPQGRAAPAMRAILVLNGTLGDKSFFDSAQRGMERARRELGVQTETIEMGYDPAKWQAGLEDVAANKSYDILIVGTFQMTEFLQTVAPKYPNKKFIIFDVTVDYAKCKCGNVYSILYKQNEGSYLAGLYGGLMLKKKNIPGMTGTKIGVVGGLDIPVINDFIVGYKQGAKAAGLDPNRDVLVQYAGAFNDPAKGKEITKAMYRQGAAIVFNVAGGTGVGILEAAAEDGRWAIGVDSDQYEIFKAQKPAIANRILTSMLKNVDNSLHRALRLAREGKVPWGKAEALGIAEGGVGLARNENFKKWTPADVVAAIDQAQRDILSGKIKVETVFK